MHSVHENLWTEFPPYSSLASSHWGNGGYGRALLCVRRGCERGRVTPWRGDWNGTFSLHYFLFDLEDPHQREISWFVFKISTVILWKWDELGPLQGRTNQGNSDSWIRKAAGWPLNPIVSFYLTCPVGCHCTWKWLLGFLGPPFWLLSILQTTESLFVL